MSAASIGVSMSSQAPNPDPPNFHKWQELSIERVLRRRRVRLRNRFRIPEVTKSATRPGNRLILGKESVCWIEPSSTSLVSEFCSQTSLHGLRYISQPKRHLVERLFWSISFTVGMGLSIWLINDVWLKFNDSPVIVTFGSLETTVDEIPFPAITICNMNKVLKSKAQEYIREASEDIEKNLSGTPALQRLFYMNHICTSSCGFSKGFNYSATCGAINASLISKLSETEDEQNGPYAKPIRGFFRNATQQCTDMIPLCIWRDNVRPCPHLFRHTETDLGKCCSFNAIPRSILQYYKNTSNNPLDEIGDWDETKLSIEDLVPRTQVEKATFAPARRPRRVLSAGKSYGLSFLLRPDLEEYFCTSGDSAGFRLLTHLPISMPHLIDFGIGVKPNAELFVKVRADITLAADDIERIPLEKRKCYLKGEFGLKFYRYYTMSNCIDECVSNQTFATCHCVQYFMPNDGTRDLCGPAKSSCAEDLRRSFINSDLKESCQTCLQTCTEIQYTTAGSAATSLQDGYKLWEGLDGENDILKNRNATIVHVFFAEHSFYPKIRKELFGVTDLMANTGGLLSLCLGFSGLSAVELLYYLTLKAWCRSRHQRLVLQRIGRKLEILWRKIRTNRVGPKLK